MAATKPFVSRDYWERRYRNNGTSGAGSYNRLAQFKADVIGDILCEYDVRSLIDFGVGDGNQLAQLKLESLSDGGIEYIGVDVSPKALSMCRERFPSLRFMLDTDPALQTLKCDMVMSCDVIYHLIEDRVYAKYMTDMFRMATKYVLIYAYDFDLRHATHVRYRKFTTYIAAHFPDWKLIKHVPQKYPQTVLGRSNESTSRSDFYLFAKQEAVGAV